LAPVAPILDSDGNPIWKVLVFDDFGRDVVSSVLRVSDLRTMGVTMHKSVLPKRRRGGDSSNTVQTHWYFQVRHT
jgi:hypothetical protein